MDVVKMFHMKGGHDKTSYSGNSFFQKKAADMVKHIATEAVQEVYLSKTPEILTISDLGCGSGRNSLSTIRDLYHAVEDAYQKTYNNGPKSTPAKVSSVSVYLNDLPTNDFNSIFRAIPDFFKEEGALKKQQGNDGICMLQGNIRPSLFIAAAPGSFYAPIFPPNFLHFIYSNYSLHWLSKVPPGIYDEHGMSMNKGCIYICENSPPAVIQAYVQQFREDFSRFLQLRSQELTSGGRMLLVFEGRESPNHIDRRTSLPWELLARSFAILISKGQVEEEKLNSYDIHFYAPSKEEIEEEVRKEGSFKIVNLEKFYIEEEVESGVALGTVVANTVRAIQESMISHHFGEEILDSLFHTYAQLVDEEISKQDITPTTFLLNLSKI